MPTEDDHVAGEAASTALRADIGSLFTHSREATLTEHPSNLHEINIELTAGTDKSLSSAEDAKEELKEKIMRHLDGAPRGTIWWSDGPEIAKFPSGWKAYCRFCVTVD